jgi:hypothetical protein
MTSGYFVLTSIPDYFCEEATCSIGRKIVSTWIPRMNEVKLLTMDKELKVLRLPKFLGCIISRYHATRVGTNFVLGVIDDEMARNTQVS